MLLASLLMHSVTSNARCHYYKELFMASNGASTMGLEDDGSSDYTCQEIKMEAAFFQVNRGASPSALSWFVSCAYIISIIYTKYWMRACCWIRCMLLQAQEFFSQEWWLPSWQTCCEQPNTLWTSRHTVNNQTHCGHLDMLWSVDIQTRFEQPDTLWTSRHAYDLPRLIFTF